MIAFDKKLYELLGKRLRELRNEKGYSLEFVANKLGITKKTLSRYETGQHRVSIDTIKHLCTIYGVDSQIIMHEVQHSLLNRDTLSDDVEVDRFGINKNEMIAYLEETNPELIDIYHHVTEKENLSLLFDAVKDLEPEDLEPILQIVKNVRKARGLDD